MRSPLIGDGGVARDGDGDADGDRDGDEDGLVTVVALAGPAPNDPNGTKSVFSRILHSPSTASWLFLRRCCRLPFRTIGGSNSARLNFADQLRTLASERMRCHV